MSEKRSSKEVGEDLEITVERIFKKGGYKTDRNVYMEGKSGAKHEIDVLATFEGPLHEDMILIECKHHREPVGKEVVMKLKHVLEDVGANKGIIVGTSGFTSGAVKFSKEVNIELMDNADLEGVLEKSGLEEFESEAGDTKDEKHFIQEDSQISFRDRTATLIKNERFARYGSEHHLSPRGLVEENFLLGINGFKIVNQLDESLEDLRLAITLVDEKKNILNSVSYFPDNRYLEKKKSSLKIEILYPEHELSWGSLYGLFIVIIPLQIFKDYKDRIYLKLVLKKGRKKIEERYIKPSFSYKKLLRSRKEVLEECEGRSCFIATAAFGTPLAEEINLLRAWRDNSLLTNPFGRLFIRFYYTTSPPIANLISKSEPSKKMVRFLIKKVISII